LAAEQQDSIRAKLPKHPRFGATQRVARDNKARDDDGLCTGRATSRHSRGDVQVTSLPQTAPPFKKAPKLSHSARLFAALLATLLATLLVVSDEPALNAYPLQLAAHASSYNEKDVQCVFIDEFLLAPNDKRKEARACPPPPTPLSPRAPRSSC